MNHEHCATHVSRIDGGVVYEVCDCGATRRIEPGKPAPSWHTCELCTHPYGRKK